MNPVVFDPREFFALARDICSIQTNEARYRTAVSRSYYACMLLARTKTRVKEHRHVHSIVQGALKKIQGGAPLAQKLGSLERLRELADYQVLPDNPLDRDWARNWTKAEVIAQDVLTKLDLL